MSGPTIFFYFSSMVFHIFFFFHFPLTLELRFYCLGPVRALIAALDEELNNLRLICSYFSTFIILSEKFIPYAGLEPALSQFQTIPLVKKQISLTAKICGRESIIYTQAWSLILFSSMSFLVRIYLGGKCWTEINVYLFPAEFIYSNLCTSYQFLKLFLETENLTYLTRILLSILLIVTKLK